MSINDNEIKQIATALAKLRPGFLPYPIFEQIARIVALPVVEFIPLRLGQHGQIEVLLIKRSDKDPLFAGLMHTPGTVVRADDETKGETHAHTAFERLLREELAGVTVSAPEYVGSIFHTSKRGTEQAQLFWVEVLDENPTIGEFWPVDSLPDNIIDSQRSFIIKTAEHFAQTRQG